MPTSRFALVLGSEAQGMSPVVSAQVDDMIHIKTASQLESLNVAIAGAISYII
jgi:tRNA G18 (ribose-2'-O)-methylase SpoU